MRPRSEALGALRMFSPLAPDTFCGFPDIQLCAIRRSRKKRSYFKPCPSRAQLARLLLDTST